MAIVAQGEQVTLNAQFYDPTTTAPADPSSGTFTLVFTGAATPPVIIGPLTLSQLTRNGVGSYTYTWNIPLTLELGVYQAQWFSNVSGIPQYSAEDLNVVAPSYAVPETHSSVQISSDPDVLVFDDHIAVRLHFTPKAASVYGARYTLYTHSGTTQLEVPNPFRAIQARDYNTISRVLTLRFNATLAADAAYSLHVSGLVNAAGQAAPDRQYQFATLPNVEPDIQAIETPIYVEDHSISEAAYINLDQIVELNPQFYIVDTNPSSDTMFIDPSYNGGRITIRFSTLPAGNFINGDYFQVQFKPLSRGFERWQVVAGVVVSLDAQQKYVYLDMPSLDATPVYGVPTALYYLPNTKYRVKISKEVGALN